jgi:hypothetical protein
MRFFKPADLLLTNVIAVYRVRFELAARLSSANAMGFCYGDEQGRRAFSRCLRIETGYRDYTRLNLELIHLIHKADEFLVEKIHSTHYLEPDTRAATFVHVAEPSKALFHFGSAGLKQDVGLKNYVRIIHDVLDFFREQGMAVSCVAGDMDADVRELVQEHFPQLKIREYTLEALRPVILDWAGWLICFNSFMAHYCRYLKKPAVVLHNRQVPVGYDCSNIHRQIVLHEEENWRLDEFKRFFKMTSENR